MELIEEYNRILIDITRETGFDALLEKGRHSLPGPLPDITYHVLQYAVKRHYKGEQRELVLKYIGMMVGMEERAWQLARKLKETRGELAEIEEARKAKAREAKKLHAELAKAKKSVRALREQEGALRRNLEKARAGLAEQTKAKDALEEEVAALKVRRNELMQRVQGLEKVRSRLQAEKDQQAAELVNARKSDKAMKNQLEQARKEALKWQARAKELEAALQAGEKALHSVLADLQKSLGNVRQSLDKLADADPSPNDVARIRRRVRDLEVSLLLLKGQIHASEEPPAEARKALTRLSGALKEIKEKLAKLNP